MNIRFASLLMISTLALAGCSDPVVQEIASESEDDTTFTGADLCGTKEPTPMEKQQVENQIKLIPNTASADVRAEEIKRIKVEAKAQTGQMVEQFGESNIGVINALMIGLWLSVPASLIFQILAARAWANWRRSRKLALIAAGVVLVPQLLAMLIPWGALMDFKHLEAQGAG